MWITATRPWNGWAVVHRSTPGEADDTTATVKEPACGCSLWSLYISISEGVCVAFPKVLCACLCGRQALSQSTRNILSGSSSWEVQTGVCQKWNQFSGIWSWLHQLQCYPSVSLIIDVPDPISELWYEADVHVLYKDSALEPSSPIWHATELTAILQTQPTDSPISFLYSDDGPDQHNMFIASAEHVWCWRWILLALEMNVLELEMNASTGNERIDNVCSCVNITHTNSYRWIPN